MSEQEYAKIQIEMCDQVLDAVRVLVNNLREDMKAAEVFGNGLMNSFSVEKRLVEIEERIRSIALDTLVREGEFLGLYDE